MYAEYKICPAQDTFSLNNFFIITPAMLRCGAGIGQHNGVTELSY